MKRYSLLLVLGVLVVSSIGCASGRTSWFNRGAPCSICGGSAPVYNGAIIPHETSSHSFETVSPEN